MTKRISVFDINEQFRLLEELANELDYDPETGEIKDNTKELLELLEQVEMLKEEKLDNIEYLKRDIKAKIEALKNEESRLNKRRKSFERNIERLKSLQNELLEDEKCKTDKFTYFFRKNESVNIKDISRVLDEGIYIRTKVEPDTTEIKKALKSGIDVAGAALEVKNSLNVR